MQGWGPFCPLRVKGELWRMSSLRNGMPTSMLRPDGWTLRRGSAGLGVT